MTERGDRESIPFEWPTRAEQHDKSRKRRHRRRPCGGNTPNAPSGLAFEWEVTERARGRRITALLEWNPVRQNTSGAVARMSRYRVQLQRSDDEGTTRLGRTRKWIVPEATVHKLIGASIKSGTIAEFTTDEIHDLDPGDVVIVSGVTPSGYNGTWTVTPTPFLEQHPYKFRADIGTSPGLATAFGEVHEDLTTLEVRAIRKHTWYRFRVQAENVAGCRGEWSAWSSWTLANDHVAPPSPLLVKIYAASTNRVVVDWDPPLVYLPVEGTVSATGTTTLTGSGTFFNAQVGIGTQIRVGTAGDVRTVTAIASDTSLTVDTALSTFSGQRLYTQERDPDVDGYDVWLDTAVGFPAPAYKRDRDHRATRISFRIPDADAGNIFYARVKSFDASGNRSAWIPATLTGNSSSGATPDGVMIGAGGGWEVATFTKPGRLRVREYAHKYTNLTGTTLTFRRARAVIGRHVHGSHPNDDGAPRGTGPVRVQLNLYSNIVGDLNTAIDSSTTTVLVDEETTPPGTPFEIRIDDELMNVTARTGGSNPRTYTVTRNYDGGGAATHAVDAFVYADPSEKLTTWTPVKTAIFDTDDRLKVEPSTHKGTKPGSAFAVSTIRPDEVMTMEVKNVSSDYPGEDLVIQVIMEP